MITTNYSCRDGSRHGAGSAAIASARFAGWGAELDTRFVTAGMPRADELARTGPPASIQGSLQPRLVDARNAA
jgi:hypothetical protein